MVSVYRDGRKTLDTGNNWNEWELGNWRVTSGRLETQTATESLISRSWTRRRGRNNADILLFTVREKGVT